MARVSAAAAPTLARAYAGPAVILLGLATAASLAALAELTLGPVAIPVEAVLDVLAGQGDPVHQAILIQIRLPRVLTGIAVGAALALGGAVLQGLLRNPLADPGLIGVTGGASLGAVGVIVLGDLLLGGIADPLRPFILPLAAFLGAAAVTGFVFMLSRHGGAISVGTLILAGVAITAIAEAGIGALIFLSDDQQLRDLTFWLRGALGGANWTLVTVVCLVASAAAAGLLGLARALDLFQLGERAAFHAGLNVEGAKLRAGLLTALGVGVATAAAGPIGFIGLVAPHLARLLVGAAHRWVLPASALLGIILVLLADLAVRLAVPPAEPPIGLATSLIGGPFFLWLLLRRLKGRGGLA
ncbi:MAG: FecCD family ABC transporter permease [Rhodothalassiaceae bacterium]